MKPTNIIKIFVLLILITSCSQDNDRYREFAETITVVTQQHDFEGVYMRYPYRIKFSDVSMYVMDLHGGDYFCHEFIYPSMEFVRSFAKKGKGPDELTNIATFAFDNRGTVHILNDYGRKMYTYDQENDQTELLTELPEEMLFYPNFVFYDDTTFIITDYYGKCRWFFVDHHGKIGRREGVIPEKYRVDNVPEAALGQAWNAFTSYNPHNGILALATQFGEVLEIYDLRNNNVIIKIGPGGEPVCKYKGSEAYPIGIMGYSDVFVGEQAIYALYWGHEFDKIITDEITVQGGNYIHVFNLKGKPLRRYQLDRYITGFYINEATGEVFGTDVNEEQLVTFDL